MTMTENGTSHDRIAEFFPTKLNLEAPPIHADLVQSGILDSLGLVDLLMHLEQEFGISVPFDSLDIDNFRSIARIAEFVDARSAVLKA